MPEVAEKTTTTDPCERCGTDVARQRTGLPFPPFTVRRRYCDSCEKIVNDAEAERDRQRTVEDLISRAGAPRIFLEQGYTLDTFPADDEEGQRAVSFARRWIARYLDGSPENLLLYGNVGTGKSSLAWSLIRKACEEGIDSLFLNFQRYLDDLYARMSDKNWRVDQRGFSITLLCLDDLGVEQPTDFARGRLQALVNSRAEKNLTTIVTSNYDPDELGARLGHDQRVVGQRIVSRLGRNSVQFRFKGPDRRNP
jgi:DNA replication protein DnaC